MNEETQVLPDGKSQTQANPGASEKVSRIFDLGDSGGTTMAVDKDSMVAEALDSLRSKGARST